MIRREEIPNLIKKIMLILAGIQVVLGGIWLICNLTYMPDFQETRDMLQASKTLVFDEYMGVLYPIVLRLFSVCGDGFYIPVYLLQLAIAAWSYYYLLRGLADEKFRTVDAKYVWLLVGYIVTFPMVLQCHMSILPYSLASSLLVFLVADLKKLIADRESLQKGRLIRIFVMWLFVGLLIPDYGVIATFLVAPALVIAAWKQWKRLVLFFGVAILTMATVFTTLSWVQTPGSYGRMQRSINSVLLTRFAWPYFERDSFYWDFKFWIEFEEGELAWISMYPENVFYEFGPKVEGLVGKEQADEVYGELAKLSFSLGKKDAVKALGRDVLANAGGPFAIQYQLSGKGVSYTGWNYYQMQGNVPGLTKYYVSFAMYGFGFLLALAAWNCWCRRKGCKLLEWLKKTAPVLLGLGVMVLWYTMIGNGMQDYLKVIPVILFWCSLPVSGMKALLQRDEEESAE